MRSAFLLQPASRSGDVADGERHDARRPEALVAGRVSESPASVNGNRVRAEHGNSNALRNACCKHSRWPPA
eukprot:SM000304S11851  [mRNA]  locus=s304:55666:55981:- [translate_table: standard]